MNSAILSILTVVALAFSSGLVAQECCVIQKKATAKACCQIEAAKPKSGGTTVCCDLVKPAAKASAADCCKNCPPECCPTQCCSPKDCSGILCWFKCLWSNCCRQSNAKAPSKATVKASVTAPVKTTVKATEPATRKKIVI